MPGAWCCGLFYCHFIAVDRNPLLHFKFTNVKIKSIKEILNAYLAAKIIKKIKIRAIIY